MEQRFAKGLVTIALPTYNRAGSYLKPSLDSLIGQTYKNVEILISDNASEDDTEAVCREYEMHDPRIKYFRRTENIGPWGNANFFRSKVGGEYFLQASDDDIWEPTFLEKCVKLLEANPDAIAAGTNFIEFDDLGRTVSYYPELYYPNAEGLYKRLKQFILFDESDAKVMFVYGLWRSEAVANYILTEYWGWDMNFVFRGLTMGRFVLVNEVLFRKRISATALDPPRKKFFLRRVFDSLWQSRIKRVFSPFFYVRTGHILRTRELSIFEKFKLIFWNFFAMSRLFWQRKI